MTGAEDEGEAAGSQLMQGFALEGGWGLLEGSEQRRGLIWV